MADAPQEVQGLEEFLRSQGTLATVSELLNSSVERFLVHRAPQVSPQGESPEAGDLPPLGQTPLQPPASVLRLARRLRAGADLAEREERITCAYQLGRADGWLAAHSREASRVYQDPTPPVLEGRNSYFVVLRGVEGAPFWTHSRGLYHSLVRPSGHFVRGSVTRGLVSRAEFEGYCHGLGRTPPERVA